MARSHRSMTLIYIHLHTNLMDLWLDQTWPTHGHLTVCQALICTNIRCPNMSWNKVYFGFSAKLSSLSSWFGHTTRLAVVPALWLSSIWCYKHRNWLAILVLISINTVVLYICKIKGTHLRTKIDCDNNTVSLCHSVSTSVG